MRVAKSILCAMGDKIPIAHRMPATPPTSDTFFLGVLRICAARPLARPNPHAPTPFSAALATWRRIACIDGSKSGYRYHDSSPSCVSLNGPQMGGEISPNPLNWLITHRVRIAVGGPYMARGPLPSKFPPPVAPPRQSPSNRALGAVWGDMGLFSRRSDPGRVISTAILRVGDFSAVLTLSEAHRSDRLVGK